MDLEYVAAQAFLNELVKIANDTEDEGTKTAAMTLHREMTVEEVVSVIKEAGIIGGLGRAVGGLASRGASVVGGAVSGAANRIHSAGSSALAAIKAAPGNASRSIDARLSAFGAAQKDKGALQGDAIRSRIINGPAPKPVPEIQPARPGQVMRPQAAAPAPAVPELGSAPVGNVQSPFQPLGASQTPQENAPPSGIRTRVAAPPVYGTAA